MSFDLKNLPRYQVRAKALCPSGFVSGDKTSEVSKFDSRVSMVIDKLKDPTKIANKLVSFYNENVRGEKQFKVGGIGVVDDKHITIDLDNTHPNARFFTNVYAIRVDVKEIR